jgi:hypothetical protein
MPVGLGDAAILSGNQNIFFFPSVDEINDSPCLLPYIALPVHVLSR